MSENPTEKYWISWGDGSIKVGGGDQPGNQAIMTIADFEGVYITHFMVVSKGADTQWTFKVPGKDIIM